MWRMSKSGRPGLASATKGMVEKGKGAVGGGEGGGTERAEVVEKDAVKEKTDAPALLGTKEAQAAGSSLRRGSTTGKASSVPGPRKRRSAMSWRWWACKSRRPWLAVATDGMEEKGKVAGAAEKEKEKERGKEAGAAEKEKVQEKEKESGVWLESLPGAALEFLLVWCCSSVSLSLCFSS